MMTLLSATDADETVAAPHIIHLCLQAIGQIDENDGSQFGKQVQNPEDREKQNESTSGKRDCVGIGEQIQEAFLSSGYQLKNVHCLADGLTLSLSGFVNRNFDLEMATQIARRPGNGRRIELRIEVCSNQSIPEDDLKCLSL